MDADHKIVRVPTLTFEEVARQISKESYTTIAFLEELVRQRQERLAARISGYIACGATDVADYAQRNGDAIAIKLEALLAELAADR